MRTFLLAATMFPALALAGPADLDPTFGTLGVVAGDYADSPLNRYLPFLEVGPTPGGYTALIQREVSTPPNVEVFRVTFDAAGKETGAVSLGVDSAIFGGGHVYPDGRVLFAHAEIAGNDAALIVARRLPDGTPDPTFGGGDGEFRLPTQADLLRPESVDVTAAGQIAVAGYRAFPPDYVLATRDTFVLRLGATGVPVTAFSLDGLAFLDMVPNQAESPNAVALTPAGQVLICSEGMFGGQYDALLARLRSTGVVDSFGSSGILYYDSTLPAQANQTDYCSDVDVNPVSGAIVMTTLRYGSSGNAGARFVPVDNGGNAGAAFDNVVAPFLGSAKFKFDGNGRGWMTVPTRRPPSADLDIVRFTPAGAPDANFGVGGTVRHALPVPASAAVSSLVLSVAPPAFDARGRVLLGASLYENADDDAGWAMLRLQGDALHADGFE